MWRSVRQACARLTIANPCIHSALWLSRRVDSLDGWCACAHRCPARRNTHIHRHTHVLVCTIRVPWIKEPSSHMVPRPSPYSPFRVYTSTSSDSLSLSYSSFSLASVHTTRFSNGFVPADYTCYLLADMFMWMNMHVMQWRVDILVGTLSGSRIWSTTPGRDQWISVSQFCVCKTDTVVVKWFANADDLHRIRLARSYWQQRLLIISMEPLAASFKRFVY